MAVTDQEREPVEQPGRHADGPGGDQFYVTHCAVTDSVLNNPGYTVRAASATEPAALDAAFHYPPYELPIDLWKDLPPPARAPRRLARTNHPKGGVWVVHSTYLAKDTVGRDRSYFSHLLLLTDADPAAVLRSWGADEWATHYRPGASRELPDDARLPVGELVSDAALTAFLGDDPDGPTELSATVCPERLRENTDARRELFARALHALLLLAEEENDTRRRLYVLAEPGLVALLLYSCVRLLPPAVTDGLTFSTFEAYHRNIRDYKLAEVVGTYLGSPDRGLDPDLATTRGIALDTFAPNRSSAELRAGAPLDGVSALVDLVAAGDWDFLPAVRQAVGKDPGGLHNAGAALARARGLARADAGDATVADLLALQRDTLAAEELKSRADRVWAVIKPAALARPDVRAAFRELLAAPERVREVWEEAVEAVLKEDFRAWDARWAVVREAAGTEEAARRLERLVNSEKNEARLARLPAAIRDALRRACADVNLFPSRPLLVPAEPGELDVLLRALPAWAGYTAFVLLAADELNWLANFSAADRGPMRARARAYLFAAPPAAVAAYVRAARPLADTNPASIVSLFAPHSATTTALMDGLLGSPELQPADWMALCQAVGLERGKWGAFLLEKSRLANLLVGLGGDGTGKAVWAGYLDSLTPALVSPDLSDLDGGDAVRVHEWERTVHAHLRAAAARLTAGDVRLVHALPDGGVARLFAANALVKWADDPASVPHDAPDEVPHACDAFGLDRLDLVRAAYLKGELSELPLPDRAEELAAVVDVFRACFPADGSFNTARRAATEAIRLSSDCPERARGALQAHLILACVPDIHFPGLIEDSRQFALDPYAVARMRERLAKSAKKAGAKYDAPEPAAAPFEDEPAPDEEAAPVIAPTRKKKGRKASYKKGRGCAGVVLLVVLLAVLVALVVLGERGA